MYTYNRILKRITLNVRDSFSYNSGIVTSSSASTQTWMSILKMLLVIGTCVGQVYFITQFFSSGSKKQSKDVNPFARSMIWMTKKSSYIYQNFNYNYIILNSILIISLENTFRYMKLNITSLTDYWLLSWDGVLVSVRSIQQLSSFLCLLIFYKVRMQFAEMEIAIKWY